MFSSSKQRDVIEQSLLIEKLNQLCVLQGRDRDDSQYGRFNEDGICSVLTNLYLEWASAGKRKDFFDMLRKLSNEPVSQALADSLRPFMDGLFQYTLNIWLADRHCLDSFSFAADTKHELKNHLDTTLRFLQKSNAHRYVHATFSIHSFAIEQIYQHSTFSYIVYDPNGRFEPLLCQSNQQILDAIIAAQKLVQPFALKPHLPLKKDTSISLTCYVYPSKPAEEKDPILIKAAQEIQDKIDLGQGAKCLPYLEEAKRTIERYHEFYISRGVALKNLLWLYQKITAISGLQFASKKFVQETLRHHLVSEDFSSIYYANRHCALGKSTLLHELARIGDISAVVRCLTTANLSIKNQDGRTALDLAIVEGFSGVTKEILHEMIIKKYTLDLTKLRRNTRNASNRISFSLQYSNAVAFNFGAIHTTINEDEPLYKSLASERELAQSPNVSWCRLFPCLRPLNTRRAALTTATAGLPSSSCHPERSEGPS